MISPLPKLKCKNGKFIEFCFGAACKGLKCMSSYNCQRMHLNAYGDLRYAPREAAHGILAWLERDAVRGRIHLSDSFGTDKSTASGTVFSFIPSHRAE